MLEILNEEFFGFDIEVVDNYISINIMVDPQKFTLKTYKRSPFASIIIKSADDANWLAIQGETRENILELLMSIKHSKMKKYNIYNDDEYDKIAKLYDDRLFHTIMFYFDIDEDITESEEIAPGNDILIGGFPIAGMVSKIQKSQHFIMYNGALIHCKPYKFGDNNQFYDKILYCLTEVKSFFSFQEFITTPLENIGVMLNHSFYLYIEDMGGKITCIREKTEEASFPIASREHMFNKPSKNIFFLEDVPKDIMNRNDILSIRIK